MDEPRRVERSILYFKLYVFQSFRVLLKYFFVFGLQYGTKCAFYGIAVEADAKKQERGAYQSVSVIGGCLTFTSSISS